MRLIYLFAFVSMLLSCTTQKNIYTIDVIEVNTIENPNINLEDYQDKDVAVFRGNKGNNMVYNLTLFKIHEGKLRPYSAIIFNLYTYDKATYEWVNDSTVNFNLINKYHSHESYNVMGYGRTTTLITE